MSYPALRLTVPCPMSPNGAVAMNAAQISLRLFVELVSKGRCDYDSAVVV